MCRLALVALLVGLGLASLVRARPAVAQPPLCLGEAATIVTNGPGTVYGTGGRDVIFSWDSTQQTIYAFGGDDLVCASGGDVVYAGSGNDTVVGFDAIAFYGESGNDYMNADPGVKTMSGGSGDDFLRCLGCDAVLGGSGNDVLQVLVKNGLCDGGSGTDSVIGQNDVGVACDTIKGVP